MLKNVNALKVRFFLLKYSCFLRFCLNDQDENDEVKMLHCYIFTYKLDDTKVYTKTQNKHEHFNGTQILQLFSI